MFTLSHLFINLLSLFFRILRLFVAGVFVQWWGLHKRSQWGFQLPCSCDHQCTWYSNFAWATTIRETNDWRKLYGEYNHLNTDKTSLKQLENLEQLKIIRSILLNKTLFDIFWNVWFSKLNVYYYHNFNQKALITLSHLKLFLIFQWMIYINYYVQK